MLISHSSSHTALVIWIWFILSRAGRPRKRANSLMSILGVEDGGTVMNRTGRRPSWLGWRRRSDQLKYLGERIPATFVYSGIDVEASPLLTGVRVGEFDGAPELLHRGGLPGGRGPGDDQAASGSALLAAVEQQQAAYRGGDGVHRGGLQHHEPCVVVLPLLQGPFLANVRCWGGGCVDELLPPVPGGQRVEGAVLRGGGLRRRHHAWASWYGS
ncbi:hypothetical protein [Streptomyces olindensis]|uniref:hypothetical protein n=1 Tax=Streptomyces olindensis TaxID=358823 RepID=UPI00365DEE5C